MPLRDTALSLRAYSRLRKAGIETVEALAHWSRHDLRALPGFGARCLAEVVQLLTEHGMKLAESADCKAPGCKAPDARQARILAMRAEGLSLARIAEREGISKQAVWERLNRRAIDAYPPLAQTTEEEE